MTIPSAFIHILPERECEQLSGKLYTPREAGVGKTAIVEGLARKVAEGRVPEVLRNVRILSISINAVQSGTKYFGTLPEKMEGLIKEAAQDGLILLFDEIHGICAGAGGA